MHVTGQYPLVLCDRCSSRMWWEHRADHRCTRESLERRTFADFARELAHIELHLSRWLATPAGRWALWQAREHTDT